MRPRFKDLASPGAPRSLREAIFAALAGLAATFVAMIVALFVKMHVLPHAPRFSGAALFGVLASALLFALVRSPRLCGRAGAVAALAPLGVVPILFLALAIASDPLVSLGWRCGTAQAGAFAMLAVILVPSVAGSAFLATFARSPRLDPLIRGAAVAIVLTAGLGAALGLARLGRPDPDTYLASLTTASFTVGSAHDFPGVGAVRYRRQSAPAPGEPSVDCVLEHEGGRVVASVPCVSTGKLTVTHDPRAELWVIDIVESVLSLGVRREVFLRGEPLPGDLYVVDVGGRIAPPIGWTLGAVVGFVVGMSLLVASRRVRGERLARNGLEATVAEGGWVAVPGAVPVVVDGASRLTGKPVVIELSHGPEGTYREPSSPRVIAWQEGTLEDLRADIAARATTWAALALTSALLSAAPLLLTGLGGSR